MTNKKQKKLNTAEKRRARQKRSEAPIAPTTAGVELKRRQQLRPSLFERLALYWATDAAIDLGTSNVCIYVKGRGIVLDEPTYVARDTKTHEVLALGSKAKDMLGRTPEGIEVVQPLKNGVIVDYDLTSYLITYFVRSILPASFFFKPRILVCVPSGITPVEKRAVLEIVLHAGARKTVLIEASLSAALGLSLDKAKSPGGMIIDLGGGTTDIAVLSKSGIVVSESLRLGGDSLDEALILYLRRRRKLLIGKRSAEQLKCQIGTVDRRMEGQVDVCGRDLSSGLPKTLQVSTQEIQKALEEPIYAIVERVKDTLEKTPPELLAEIADHGIALTGGGAMLDGLDRLLTEVTGIATFRVERPRYSAILGASRALKEMGHLADQLDLLQ